MIQNYAERMTKEQLEQWLKSTDRGIKESRYKHLYGKSAEEFLKRERKIIEKELKKKQ